MSAWILTEKGRDLFPALMALMTWGDRWVADLAGPAVQIMHAGCGAPVTVAIRCEQHGQLGMGEIQALPGPGAKKRNA